MAKPVTLAELNTALKPLFEAIKRLSEDQTHSNAQVSELHSITSALSAKMDILSNNIDSKEADAKSKTVKKTTRKTTKTTEEPKVVKMPTKIGSKVVDPEPMQDPEQEAEPVLEDEPEAEPQVEEKKIPTKKALPTKAKAKPKVQAKPKSNAKLNKMTYFNLAYEKTPEVFDEYLTEEVKTELAEQNSDTWSKASKVELAKLQKAAYYAYMKDNKDAELCAMRDAYICTTATADE
jgi:hypothetical protein